MKDNSGRIRKTNEKQIYYILQPTPKIMRSGTPRTPSPPPTMHRDGSLHSQFIHEQAKARTAKILRESSGTAEVPTESVDKPRAGNNQSSRGSGSHVKGVNKP